MARLSQLERIVEFIDSNTIALLEALENWIRLKCPE